MSLKQLMLAMVLFVFAAMAGRHIRAQQNNPPPPPPTVPPVAVDKTYKPTGFMGDGKSGTSFVQFTEVCKENPHKGPTCIKVTYTAGPQQWAGMYWQNAPNNWGDVPGTDLSSAGYTKITFWARGAAGNEIVEFKVGGIDSTAEGKKNKDSLEVSLGKVSLTKNWTQYTIDLRGQNLSSVIGTFCWVVSSAGNPGGATFYLSEIQYE